MSTSASPIAYRYVRWKAVLFGLVPTLLGAAMIGIGVVALDPTWTAQVARGPYLVDAPVWIRSPVMFATGGFVFVPGLRLLYAAVSNARIATFDEHGITARTLFGRRRHVEWRSIQTAKRKKNQIILSPADVDTLGQEIWDRKSVFLDIGMLDAVDGDIEAQVRRHRPDLVIPPIA